MSDWLGQDSHLLDLFQPSPRTRPLFKTFLALTAPGLAGQKPGFVTLAVRTIVRLTAALARYNTVGFLIGAAIGAGVSILLRWLTISGTVRQLLPPPGWPMVWAVVGVLFSAWLGGLISGTVGLFRIVMDRIPANFFGMCRGHAPAATGAGAQRRRPR